MDPKFFRKYADIITEAEQVDEFWGSKPKSDLEKFDKENYLDPATSQRVSQSMANNPGQTRQQALKGVEDTDAGPADDFLNVERTFGVDHNSPEGKWLANNDDVRAKLVRYGIADLNPQQKQQLVQKAIQMYGR